MANLLEMDAGQIETYARNMIDGLLSQNGGGMTLESLEATIREGGKDFFDKPVLAAAEENGIGVHGDGGKANAADTVSVTFDRFVSYASEQIDRISEEVAAANPDLQGEALAGKISDETIAFFEQDPNTQKLMSFVNDTTENLKEERDALLGGWKGGFVSKEQRAQLAQLDDIPVLEVSMMRDALYEQIVPVMPEVTQPTTEVATDNAPDVPESTQDTPPPASTQTGETDTPVADASSETSTPTPANENTPETTGQGGYQEVSDTPGQNQDNVTNAPEAGEEETPEETQTQNQTDAQQRKEQEDKANQANGGDVFGDSTAEAPDEEENKNPIMAFFEQVMEFFSNLFERVFGGKDDTPEQDTPESQTTPDRNQPARDSNTPQQEQKREAPAPVSGYVEASLGENVSPTANIPDVRSTTVAQNR